MTNEELVEHIQNGMNTKENMGLLYEQNIGFITKIVHLFSAYAEEEDLMQEAYIGLHKAVEGFDTSKGFLFLTYASYYIKQECRRYLDNCVRIKRIPVPVLEKIRKYKKLQAEYNENLTEEIVMDKMGLSKEQYDFLMQSINEDSVISIDTPLQTKVGETMILADSLEDSIDIESDVIENDCKNRIWNIINDILNDKQKDIIISYYLNQRAITEMAEEAGVSKQRISSIKNRALSILREIKELQDLAEFWGYDSMMAYTGKNCVENIAIRHIEMKQKHERLKENFSLVISDVVLKKDEE